MRIHVTCGASGGYRSSGCTGPRYFHLEQRLQVKTELLLIGHRLSHGRVQTMQAIDENDVAGMKLHRSWFTCSLARLEVVARDAHFFTGDQAGEVLINQRQVQCLGRFEIIIAEFILGVLFQVIEVVIHVERHQVKADPFQMLADLDSGSGLAGGRRTGDDDHTDLVLTAEDQLGCIFHVLVVELFGCGDQLEQLTAGDALVQAFDRVDTLVDGPIENVPDLGPGDVLIGLRSDLGAFVTGVRAVPRGRGYTPWQPWHGLPRSTLFRPSPGSLRFVGRG